MTPEGTKALKRLRTLARRNDDEFLDPLTEDERAQLHTLLTRLAEKHEPSCVPFAAQRESST
jgi:DNA-binding MarR family transcriptional regulator